MQTLITPEYLASQGFSTTLPERFWSKVDKHGPFPATCLHLGRCWLWTGATMKGGYGKISPSGHGGNNLVSAHRVSWILSTGPVANGLWVLHHCDTCPCVNPGHLFLGTRQDNVTDMMRKGRGCTGEKQGRSKLTWNLVTAMREAYASGMSGNRIAALTGMSPTAARSAIYGRTWKGSSH